MQRIRRRRLLGLPLGTIVLTTLVAALAAYRRLGKDRMAQEHSKKVQTLIKLGQN